MNWGRDGLVGLVLKEMLGKTDWIRERWHMGFQQ